MRLRLALAALPLAAVFAGNAAAQSPLYYCDTWGAYYPGVRSCPVPWRTVNPATASPQLAPQPIPQSATTAHPVANGATLGDALDEWCKTVSLPSSIALCSEPELRALTVERQHAYDEAKAKLNADQQKALLTDQNGWVKSYPASCGLATDLPPALPLAQAIKNCMAQAGRARIAYLRGYTDTQNVAATPTPLAAPPIASTASPSDRIGPGFDCAKTAQPLARLICSSPELSRTDLLFNQAYQALFQQLDPVGQRQLQAEDVAFLNSVLLACGIPENGPVPGSPDCVATHYSKKRSEWLLRLSGPAREEAVRVIEQHVALQADLQRLGFLSASARIDGVYNTAARSAILAWQSKSGRPTTGFIGDADALALESGVRQETAGSVVPAASATTVALAPPLAVSPAASAGDEVSLTEKGETYLVPVRINDAITLDFLIDSGASDVLIPADVAMTLFRTKTLAGGDFLGERTYVLADGSKLPSARFTLRQLKVGSHVVLNVTASVGPATSEPLLGQSFLSRFGSWTMDNGRHILLLTERGGISSNVPASATSQPATCLFADRVNMYDGMYTCIDGSRHPVPR
jgi:clan AA aspartic protease (TIGR02281 family)